MPLPTMTGSIQLIYSVHMHTISITTLSFKTNVSSSDNDTGVYLILYVLWCRCNNFMHNADLFDVTISLIASEQGSSCRGVRCINLSQNHVTAVHCHAVLSRESLKRSHVRFWHNFRRHKLGLDYISTKSISHSAYILGIDQHFPIAADAYTGSSTTLHLKQIPQLL